MADYRKFTYAEYIALGKTGPWTAPFALENREALDKGGAGNYFFTRQSFADTLLGGCVHITAGISDYVAPDLSAESTTDYGRTTTVQASWTGIVDSDTIINSLHPNRTAFCQGVKGYTFNQPIVGVEIGKKDTNWSTTPQTWVDATLKNLAAYYAPYVVEYNWPLQVVRDRNKVQEYINLRKPFGFTEHYILSPETRDDAGLYGGRSTFPWDRFFTFLKVRIAELNGTKAPEPLVTPESVVKDTILEVTATMLNTRVEPSADSGICGQAPQGTKLKATGKVSGAWVQAASPYQLEKGTSSWWNSGFLKVVSQPRTVTLTRPVLSLGSEGDVVKKLQSALLTKFKDKSSIVDPIKRSGGADGHFGAGTADAIGAYQRLRHLTADEVVGSKTWTALAKDGIKP